VIYCHSDVYYQSVTRPQLTERLEEVWGEGWGKILQQGRGTEEVKKNLAE